MASGDERARGETFVLERASQAIDFTTVLLGFASSALIHMGVQAHPESGTVNKDAELAREVLDPSLLREKTRGNLTMRRSASSTRSSRTSGSSSSRRSPVDCAAVRGRLAGAGRGHHLHAGVRRVGRGLGQRGRRPVRPRDPERRVAPRGTPTADLFARLAEAHARASQPDRHARAALLVVVAISMFFTFVSAGRVLRPAGLPREGIRRLLCGAALVSAVLRTVDGAADAAFALRFARFATQVLPPGSGSHRSGPRPDVDPGHLHHPDRARRRHAGHCRPVLPLGQGEGLGALKDEAPR